MERNRFPPTGWIRGESGIPDDGSTKLYYYRKVIKMEQTPGAARIKVSADTRYRLYVNGKSVSFGPCKGDGQVWFFEEPDIAPYLVTGDNVIAAAVLRFSPLVGGGNSFLRTNYPGFYLQGALSYPDKEEPINADETWRWLKVDSIKFVAESERLKYLSIFERAGGNPETRNWMLPNYDDSKWAEAIPYNMYAINKSASPANLHPRPIPPMYEIERRFIGIKKLYQSSRPEADWAKLFKLDEALELEAGSTHILEIDAGELTTGFLEFSFEGGEKSELKILTSEAYAYEDEKRAWPRKGDRTDSENGRLYGYVDQYTVGGFGNSGSSEKYEPFWFRTLRYLRLTVDVKNAPLRLRHVKYRETGYPLEVKTEVHTSDASMDAVWDISLRSLRRCMHETYEDCPFYEQQQFAMDARSQILFTYAVAADDRMARRTIDDFHRSLRSDGMVNCCWPSIDMLVIPGFSLFYVMMIYDHMMYFGDAVLVRRYMPTVDAILDYFERSIEERGLVGSVGGIIRAHAGWSFIDWAPGWIAGVPDASRHGPISVESMMYAYTLDMAGELADFLQKPEQGNSYRERAVKIKVALNAHCVGGNGLYQDGPGLDKYSQHCQVWAVLSNTAPKGEWASLMKKTLTDKTLSQCSVAMAFYLFRAVEAVGLYEETDSLWELWRNMLRNKLSTCEEDQVNTRSDCHAWGSVALYELPSVVLGVQPARPGYGAIRVRPVPGYMEWAAGDVCTPKGMVHVEWKRAGGGVDLKVSAPEGVEVIKDIN